MTHLIVNAAPVFISICMNVSHDQMVGPIRIIIEKVLDRGEFLVAYRSIMIKDGQVTAKKLNLHWKPSVILLVWFKMKRILMEKCLANLI